MTDTDPQTEAVYRRMLMARSPEDRFMMGVRMCEMARKTVLASLPPGLGPLERKIALLHRYYASDFSDGELAKIEAAIRSADMKNSAAAAEVSLRAGGLRTTRAFLHAEPCGEAQLRGNVRSQVKLGNE